MNGLKIFGWFARTIYRSGILRLPILQRRLSEKRFDAWIERIFRVWSYPITITVKVGQAPIRLTINPRDGIIERHLLTRGAFDPHLIESFIKNINSGDTVVDIGANIGYYSLVFSTLVGSEGHVVACEPFPRALDHLKTNLSLNRALASRITLLEVACSDSQKTLHMEHADGNLGGSSVHEGTGGISVPGNTLDTLLANESNVSFIKIDIEGYEMEALEGAQAIITKHRPRIIFEYSPSLYTTMSGDPQKRALETCAAILRHSYTFSVIERDSHIAPIIDIGEFIQNTKKQKNILCIPQPTP